MVAEQEELLLQKAVQHERGDRHTASQFKEQIQTRANEMLAESQEEYWKKDLKLRKEQLALLDQDQKDSKEDETTKASALAQIKYDEFLTYSADLEDSLNDIEDWSKE